MRLKDRVALVTGAASGIGRQIALRFAREGAMLGIADIDAGAARRVADEINQGGGVADAVALDVADEAQVEAGVDAIAARFGAIDILVSNAGIQHIAPLVELSLADWRTVLSVHLDGAFLTTRACMQRMIRQGRGGMILYTGSVHSVEASPLKAPYVAAKHGLLGLARLVAKEGAAHGIGANVICPGFVRTPLVEAQIPEQARSLGISQERVVRDVMLRQTVDGEFTTMEDVAEVALFFCAFPSRALTGQSLLVSHGWHMQ
ncbi:MAG TPA: 3-hydroxybutyrate dehydrogenase [Isosphaeraceae bacterium]|jgi:3-hydroxybutyrate dehydrogenase